MEHQPLSTGSASDVSDVDDVNRFQIRAKKMSQTPFRLLVASVVLGAVALAGINNFGLPHATEQHDSPLMRYKKLMMAFSARFHDPSKISWAHSNTFLQAFTARMLGATDEFTGSLDFIFKQQGAANPNAMSLVLATQASTNNDPRAKLTIKVKAKKGKEQELKKLLEPVSPSTKIDGSDVVLEFPFPSKTQQEFVDSVKEDPATNIGLELYAGTTIDELRASEGKNIVEAIKGLRVKGTFKTASSLFGALTDTAEAKDLNMGMGMDKDAEDEVGHFMEGIASVEGTTTVQYKSADQLKALYDGMPTLTQLFDMLKDMVRGLTPRQKKLIKELPATCDGLSGASLSGGGFPKDLVLTMTNFKPMPLVVDAIKAVEEALGQK